MADPSPLDGALKKLALLSAVCLIFACESPTMPRTSSVPVKPAAAVVYNVRDQRVAGVINDCTGEGFAFDVTFSDLLGVTENANGFHATRHASIHGQAVSLLTGATYNVSDVINMTLDIGAADNFTRNGKRSERGGTLSNSLHRHAQRRSDFILRPLHSAVPGVISTR